MISDTWRDSILAHAMAKDLLKGHSGHFMVFRRDSTGLSAYWRIADAYQLESERLAYEYMLEQYKARGDTGMVRRLEQAPVTISGGTPAGYVALRDPAMHKLGIGTIHEMDSVITGIFFPSLASPDYTLLEKLNMWRGKSRAGVSIVWEKMLAIDLSLEFPNGYPTYFSKHRRDTCSMICKLCWPKMRGERFLYVLASAHSHFEARKNEISCEKNAARRITAI